MLNYRGIKTVGLLALRPVFAGTTASIGLEISPTSVTEFSGTKTTVEYIPNTSYEPCTCDLTARTCDAYCCCDSECSFVSHSRNYHAGH